MKFTVFGIVFALLLVISITPHQVVGDNHDACKKLFEDKKCNACHGAESLGMEPKNKKNPAPDFCKTPLAGDNDFLKKYLNKEEKLHDKAHPVKFNGSAEELEAMLSCLAELAPKAETGEGESSPE